MKRFAFRLQRLLDLRASTEQVQARELGSALRDEEQHRQALESGMERLEAAREQQAATPRELSQAGTLENVKLALQALTRETEALQAQHQESLARVERERQAFEEARRARRVLERLRETRQDAWQDEVAREEQINHDETALRRRMGPLGSEENP